MDSGLRELFLDDALKEKLAYPQPQLLAYVCLAFTSPARIPQVVGDPIFTKSLPLYTVKCKEGQRSQTSYSFPLNMSVCTHFSKNQVQPRVYITPLKDNK